VRKLGQDLLEENLLTMVSVTRAGVIGILNGSSNKKFKMDLIFSQNPLSQQLTTEKKAPLGTLPLE
jgi:hypothetical protein